MSPSLQYLEELTKDPHPHLAVIRQEALRHKWSFMCTSKTQGSLLHHLAQIQGAKQIIELGCYLGHSTLALASALPHHGKLWSIEHNPKFAARTRAHLEHCKLEHLVTQLVKEGVQAFEDLQNQIAPGSVDLIFLDADKKRTLHYWEKSLSLLRPGGLLLIDNILARGATLNPEEDLHGLGAQMRESNEVIAKDVRAKVLGLSIGDGLLLARKL